MDDIEAELDTDTIEEVPAPPPTVHFSPSTMGFYHSHIHGENMPADAVEIIHEDHVALLAAEGDGKAIGTDKSGRPVIVDRAPPTADWIAARRDRLLKDSHWRIAEDEPDREAWLAYRKQLRELDLKKPVWPTPPAA
jgi:hypothetical protein